MRPVILTVLRSGGEYRPEHVARLERQCAEFAPWNEFRCLSDMDVPGRIPLRHDWPGWWAKMEAFRVVGPCLYLDLDSTIRGALGPLLRIAQEREFVTLRDFNWPARDVQSSIMAWNGDMGRLYEAFRQSPAKHMAENTGGRFLGDQGFIERQEKPAFWQDLAPGAIVSWKKHCKRGVPEGARVIAFHGKPRPWQVGQ